MSDPDSKSETRNAASPGFVDTHWSVVIRAGSADSPEAQQALSELCQNYWYPLYAFIRRQGATPHDAEDLTQSFFARLLAKNYIADANREKGRFRTFLLVALKRFLANEWDRQHAQKRGGFQPVVSIDQTLAESRITAELKHDQQPDLLFERQWARTLLEHVEARLQQEYLSSGRHQLFTVLRPGLVRNESALSHAQLAAELNLTPAAIKVALYRMRLRYREILREEIGKTVSSPGEVVQEIRYLFSILG